MSRWQKRVEEGGAVVLLLRWKNVPVAGAVVEAVANLKRLLEDWRAERRQDSRHLP